MTWIEKQKKINEEIFRWTIAATRKTSACRIKIKSTLRRQFQQTHTQSKVKTIATARYTKVMIGFTPLLLFLRMNCSDLTKAREKIKSDSLRRYTDDDKSNYFASKQEETSKKRRGKLKWWFSYIQCPVF